MNNSITTKEDYELWVLLHQARDSVFMARTDELREYDISVIKSGVLWAIETIGDEATPAKITRLFFRKAHSITELLIRMEKEGLITKTKDLTKKNQVRVTMTERGKQAYLQSMKRESIRRVMSALSERDKKQLKSLLVKLRNGTLKEFGIRQNIPYPPP